MTSQKQHPAKAPKGVAATPQIIFTPEQQQMNAKHQIVMSMLALSLESADDIHIFVRYSVHVNHIDISVEKKDTDYSECNRDYLYTSRLSLELDSLDDFKKLEDDLTTLVIAAKDAQGVDHDHG